MNFYTILPDEAFAKASFIGDTLYRNNLCELKKYTVEPCSTKRLGRPDGDYYTLSFDKKRFGESKFNSDIASKLSDLITKTCNVTNSLIVGLGNEYITADSLGSLVVNKLAKMNLKLRLLKPMVFGSSGIESATTIKGVSDILRPEYVIIIDSLACLGQDKLYSSFQLNNAGLTPGEGVGNKRTTIDHRLLGIDVISIGVPLVCYPEYPTIADACVTPKDIDILVDVAAEIIANAIKSAINKKPFVSTR